MAKYDPLRDWLSAQTGRSEVTMRFADIEQLIDGTLPSSAHRHSAWWSNEVGGNHVRAHAWQDAGWRVDAFDQTARWVRFRRVS